MGPNHHSHIFTAASRSGGAACCLFMSALAYCELLSAMSACLLMPPSNCRACPLSIGLSPTPVLLDSTVTRAMGVRLAKLTPTRGFSAELATAGIITIAAQCVLLAGRCYCCRCLPVPRCPRLACARDLSRPY